MRRLADLPFVLLLATLGACVVGPTEEDIRRSLDEELSSVAGDWTALEVTSGTAPASLSITFTLTEAPGGQLTGTGTQDRGATTTRPLTVTGTYMRPALALTFDGMMYEGRSVRGSFRGQYTSAGGLTDTLVLTGEGYSRRLIMLLQEKQQ